MKRTAAVNEAEMSFEVRGEGEPLLLLHGFLGCAADWSLALDLDVLAERYRLVMPDFRGHGASSNPGGVFSIRQCAKDIAALLDVLEIERCRAVGNSLGAKTLLHLAIDRPQLVSAMVLASATPRYPAHAKEAMRQMARAEHGASDVEEMARRHPGGRAQLSQLWQSAAQLAEADDLGFSPEQLAAIEARTLIVHGDRDPLYPVGLALELYEAIPKSSLWIRPDQGHSPIFMEASNEFRRCVADFLARD